MLSVKQAQLLQALPQSLQEAAAAATHLHLQQRACHVFSEAHRVLTFKHICEDTQLPAPMKLQQLGELLNASHSSCSQLYQCSCEELDTLVGVARTAGALGARLTGEVTGWRSAVCMAVAADLKKKPALGGPWPCVLTESVRCQRHPLCHGLSWRMWQSVTGSPVLIGILQRAHEIRAAARRTSCSCNASIKANGGACGLFAGAGWGGCIVALVPQEKVPAFKEQLIQQYYQPLVSQGVISETELPFCLFASSPSSGAAVIKPGSKAAAVRAAAVSLS